VTADRGFHRSSATSKGTMALQRTRILFGALASAALIFLHALFAFAQPVQAPQPSASAPPPAPAPAPAAKEAAPDPKIQARERFEKGLGLVREKAWAAALAEFLASRQLYPTKNATSNAASCLAHLQRYDEALTMTETLLRDFNLTAEEKAEAQRQAVELGARIGTLVVEGAEPGAAIVVDGQTRGEFPLLSPLRVAAGTHVVRVYKENFAPFEERVDVAGGQVARIVARLRTLAARGRLQVKETQGRHLDIVIDGNVVGKTPWEGPIAPGDHTVFLRGEGLLGTAPVSIPVPENRLTAIRLDAQELEAALSIEPTPAGASVAINGVTVGRGAWEGRLRAGSHQLEVAGQGFIAQSQTVRLGVGRREVVRVVLQRDPSSPFWKKPPPPPHPLLEIDVGLPLVPSLGGGVLGSCRAACQNGLGTGFFAIVRGGYELRSRLGFGAAAGTLYIRQSVAGRAAAITPIGQGTDPRVRQNAGFADDTIAIRRGALFLVWASYSMGDRFPLRARLGTGPLFAQVADGRSGRFTATDGKQYLLTPTTVAHGTTFWVIDPEFRAGIQFGEHVEIGLGLDVLVLIPFSTRTWNGRKLLEAGTDGLGTMPADALLGNPIVAIAPNVSARYDF
jgi:hypothetical protein